MIIQNTTYSIETAAQDEWLEWVRLDYYQFLDKANLIRDKVLSRVMIGEQNGTFSYSIQLYFDNIADYQNFEDNYLPQAEAMLIKRFTSRVLSFSTLLKVL